MNWEKTILITGCSSGIGLESARELIKQGWKVFPTVRNPNDIEKTSKELGEEVFVLDLNSTKSIDEVTELILNKTGGKMFALFNNGAYGQPGAVEDLSIEALKEQFECNLFGTHYLTTKLIAVMRKQGKGRIIQNSSVLGFAALPYRGAYIASKFALEGLTDTMRLELVGTGIHCVLIEPGPIRTKFKENAYKAFQKHIQIEGSAHEEHYRRQEERLKGESKEIPFTLDSDAVVKKLLLALNSPSPKARYYVTFPTYLFGYLKRVLPVNLMDKILRSV